MSEINDPAPRSVQLTRTATGRYIARNSEGAEIAFGRGDKAYVAINHEGSSLTRTFQTSLPAGDYCDVQSGRRVTVDGAGRFTATIGPRTALALHTGARGC